MTLEDALGLCPIVAILRGVRPGEVVAIAEALHDAGVRVVEVPLNSPDPFDSLARLVSALGDRMVCGAGTVLSPEDVDRAAAAGGRLIVSPNTEAGVIRRAVELGLDPAPGFATASEAFTALGAGARHLKLFPAATYGPGHVRQLKAVLPPQAQVWAVGGVGAENLAAFRAAGVDAFGVGSELYRPGQASAETSEKARQLVAACSSA